MQIMTELFFLPGISFPFVVPWKILTHPA
jgi:hypothetical protein